MTSEQLALWTSSPQVSHAKTSLLRGIGRGWLAHVRRCSGTFCDSPLRHMPVGYSLRTCLGCCRATADGTWVPSSEGWGNAGMGGPTECWTLSSSEWPSGVVGCSLSAVLETGPHLSKYCLSPKAARGILRRSVKRRRTLPEHLAAALRAVAGETTSTG